jgi:glycosyltransferase involved in cell wall biosynthesis
MLLYAQTRPGRFEQWAKLPKAERDEQLFVSIVIPAHNEEEFLPATLHALDAQTYTWFETIVVANGCNDRTAEVVQDLCDQCYDLRPRGLGPARNLGAQKARGKLLLFLDADTILPPDALQKIVAQFHAMGTIKGVPDTRKFSHRLIYFVKNLVHATHLHHGSSGVIICWKEHFESVGGFNNELYLRENSDLMKKLRRFGSYKYLRTTSAITSMRRYERTGTGEMLWVWVKIWWLSNFSDIRGRTYEAMCGHEPGESFITRLGKRRAALRRREAPASFW